MQNLIRFLVCLLFLGPFSGKIAFGQVYEKKIIEYVRKISQGRSDQVIKKLPELERKLPHSAGLIYIEGLISDDGDEALRCFRIIADSFPHSEWADDALARMFEYYGCLGMSEEAEVNIERLHSQYPQSAYIKTNYLAEIKPISEDSLTYIQSDKKGTDFAIQIGAFSIRENAEKLRKNFDADGYRADIYENLLDGKNVLYLVWIGNYASAGEASQHLPEIKSRYKIEGLIRPRISWKKW